MIRFSCKCKHQFNLLDSQAGEEIQCPACGLLNDVPLPADLAAIDVDGAFKLDDAPKPLEADRLREQLRYFGGNEDVRHNVREFLDIGVDEPAAIRAANERHYNIDPWTGEEIRPIPLQTNAHPLPAIPAGTLTLTRGDGKALEYERREPGRQGHLISLWRIPKELFSLGNLTVLFFLYLTHFLFQFTAAITFNAGFLFLIFALIFLLFAIIGHYGNVADETGPAGRDQLPTLLRNVSIGEDVWQPFCSVVIALLLCFGPAVYWFFRSPIHIPLHLDAGALAVVGGIFFPAVMLTTTTSGAYRNLLPHYLMRVITVNPTGYAERVILLFVAALIYGGTVGFVHVYGLFTGDIAPVTGAFLPLPAAPAILLGLFMMNWWAWSMGLFYRVHHDQFAWALQSHTKKVRSDTLSLLEHRTHAPKVASAVPPPN